MPTVSIKPRKIFLQDLATGTGQQTVTVMGLGEVTLDEIDLASAIHPAAAKGDLSGTKNGTNTTFTVPSIPASTYLTLITVNGSIQDVTANYSISGTTVTFVSAPGASDRVGYINFYTT